MEKLTSINLNDLTIILDVRSKVANRKYMILSLFFTLQKAFIHDSCFFHDHFWKIRDPFWSVQTVKLTGIRRKNA